MRRRRPFVRTPEFRALGATEEPAARLGALGRAYVGFAGGVDVPLVLGSRSTDLTGGFGGYRGRPPGHWYDEHTQWL